MADTLGQNQRQGSQTQEQSQSGTPGTGGGSFDPNIEPDIAPEDDTPLEEQENPQAVDPDEALAAGVQNRNMDDDDDLPSVQIRGTDQGPTLRDGARGTSETDRPLSSVGSDGGANQSL